MAPQTSREYSASNQELFRAALDSLHRVQRDCDIVVIEGAGSCAELNLQEREFVNFGTAEAADAKVILVGDIERGGIFAQLLGTLDLLKAEQRCRVMGLVVNKFRDDLECFREGVECLEVRSGPPVLGVILYPEEYELETEDAASLNSSEAPLLQDGPLSLADVAGPETCISPVPSILRIAILRFPHISSFTDFDTLRAAPAVAVTYLSSPRALQES